MAPFALSALLTAADMLVLVLLLLCDAAAVFTRDAGPAEAACAGTTGHVVM
jgi:hypothetical protein